MQGLTEKAFLRSARHAPGRVELTAFFPESSVREHACRHIDPAVPHVFPVDLKMV